MATLESTQDGPIHLGSTYVGGSAPADGDQVNLNHDHTVEAEFDQPSTTIWCQDGSTLDTRNAADSTNYNLKIKAMKVYEATLNLRDGTHEFKGDGSSSWSLYCVDWGADASEVIMAGCTVTVCAAYLKGKLTQSGSNTMRWGDGETDTNVLKIGGTYWYGMDEGNYNTGVGWEDATRLHLDVDGGDENSGQSFQLQTSTSQTDDDGPMMIKLASFKLVNWNGQLFRFNNTLSGDREWKFDNAVTIMFGAGEHGTTGNNKTNNMAEGNVTVARVSRVLFGGWSSNDTIAPACWIKGDMQIGMETESADGFSQDWYCGSFKSSGTTSILCGYLRVDGDLIFDGAVNHSSDLHLPNFTYYRDGTPDTAAMDPDLTADDRVHGALMVFGDVVDCGTKGRFVSYDVDYTGGHNNATVDDQEVLWVYGISSGTWKIILGENNDQSGTFPSGGGFARGPFTGSEDLGAGTFTYGNWEERAVSYLNPSGITLGTKPDSGSDSIHLIKPGDRTAGCNLIFDEDAEFNNITIDADTTITVNAGVTVTYTGTLTNNGTVTEIGDGSMEEGAPPNRTASVSGNWSATATWGGASVPTSDDPVIVNTGITATVDATGNAKSVVLNSGTPKLALSGGNTLNIPVAQSGDDGKITLSSSGCTITGVGNIKGLSKASPVHMTLRDDTNCEIIGNLQNCYLKSGSDITIHGQAIDCTFEDSTANIRVFTHTHDSEVMLDSDPAGDDDIKLERPDLDNSLVLTN